MIWPFNSATINQVLSPPLSFQRTFTPSLPTRRLAEQKRLELKLIRFPQPRAQLDNCLHSSLIATFRLPRNRGAITPGNEISSATHSWLQYHFLKLCPTVGVGCSSPRRRRTPGHSYPASRLRPGGHLALLGHEVGPRAREPLPATATGARPDARAAPGPVAPWDCVWARASVTTRTRGGPRRAQSIVLDVEWKSWVLDEQAAEKSREEREQIRTRDLWLEWEERKESLVRQTPRPPLMSPRQKWNLKQAN